MANSKTLSLIGMTGCGKSTVGRIAAELLGYRFIDLDEAISEGEGRSIPDIFSENGEKFFRELEARYLTEIAEASSSGTVIACGGGAPTYEKTRKVLAEKTYNVWIRRDPDSVALNEEVLRRPPIYGDPDKYKELLKTREAVYRATAHTELYNEQPEKCAEELCRLLSMK
ncbi:MAG: shikimate kinase [Clostridia bacterium]|nr:shikimate kinase [Clostridia bacterium]